MSSFKLVPDRLSGIELFEHQVSFRQRKCGDQDHKVSAQLDVYPCNKHQHELVPSDCQHKVQFNIMQYIAAGGGTEQLTQPKIDSISYIKYHSCFINGPNEV